MKDFSSGEGGRRKLLVGRAVVLVAGGVVASIALTGENSQTPDTIALSGSTDTAAWKIYRDEKLHFSIRYPPRWHVQPFGPSGPNDFDYLYDTGVLITNLDEDLKRPAGPVITNVWEMHGLPVGLVAIQFEQDLSGYTWPGSRMARFPLSLARTQRSMDRPDYGAPQPRLWMPVPIRGTYALRLHVWLGHAATSRQREIARRIVASIRVHSSCPAWLDAVRREATVRATADDLPRGERGRAIRRLERKLGNASSFLDATGRSFEKDAECDLPPVR